MNKTATMITAIFVMVGSALAGQYDAQARAAYKNVGAYDWSSQEAATLATQILAQPTISNAEALFCVCQSNHGSLDFGWWTNPANGSVIASLAAKNRLYALSKKARTDLDASGWTDADIRLALFDSCKLALKEGLTSAFAAQVLGAMAGTGQVNPSWKSFFKAYRATLTKPNQVSLTQKEKDGLVAVPSRTEAQDKWLTEVSADLMALSLDR